MSLINQFMNFKINTLTKIANIIISDSGNYDYQQLILTSYFKTYINAYYYNILDTLDYSSVESYDYHVIKKELEGLALEHHQNLEEVIEDYDIYQDKKRIIDEALTVSLFTVILDIKEMPNILKEINDLVLAIKDEHTELEIDLSLESVSNIARIIKEAEAKEKKFLKILDKSEFNLLYLYNENDSNYLKVKLNDEVLRLKRNYKETTLKRVFRNESLASLKFEELLTLLSRDYLKKILEKEESKEYLVYLDDELFKGKDNFLTILEKFDNISLSKKITLVVTNSIYMKHKTFLNTIKYKRAVRVDLTHIQDVIAKLDSLFQEEDFVIITSYKDEDFDALAKYEAESFKRLLFNSDFKEV